LNIKNKIHIYWYFGPGPCSVQTNK